MLGTHSNEVCNGLCEAAIILAMLLLTTGGNMVPLRIPKPRDCAEVHASGSAQSGVYTVYVGVTQRPLSVYCDMETACGGWTVSIALLILLT